jgi:hypothetical protein
MWPLAGYVYAMLSYAMQQVLLCTGDDDGHCWWGRLVWQQKLGNRKKEGWLQSKDVS